jgi:hypothetical protein
MSILADKSVKFPRGIMENLLVKVDNFIFPVDFMVLDMEVDDRVPLILGRPFLYTARELIDAFDRKIILRMGDENVTFNVMKFIKNSGGHDDSVFSIYIVISQSDHRNDHIIGNTKTESENMVLLDPP